MIKMLPIPKQYPIHSQDYYYYFTSYLLHYPCILIGPQGRFISKVLPFEKEIRR